MAPCGRGDEAHVVAGGLVGRDDRARVETTYRVGGGVTDLIHRQARESFWGQAEPAVRR